MPASSAMPWFGQSGESSMMEVLLTDQVAVADYGEGVLCPHGFRLDAVEVAGEVNEPLVVLRVAFCLPVGQCSRNGWQNSFEPK